MGERISYSIELASEICSRLLNREEDGKVRSLKSVCADPDMPAEQTVFRWLSMHKEFGELYARTREERGHLAAEDILQIADSEPDVDRARIRIDARKWYASKVAAKHYGERITNELVGANGAALVPVINVSVGRDQS